MLATAPTALTYVARSSKKGMLREGTAGRHSLSKCSPSARVPDDVAIGTWEAGGGFWTRACADFSTSV